MDASLTHEQVWTAIDRLAKKYGMSPSGLARKAGLDPTTFNKSKRITPLGKPRWPSTESISKILRATGASIEEFIRLLDDSNGNEVHLRLRLLPQRIGEEYSQGAPSSTAVSEDWEELVFPELSDEDAFAIEVTTPDYQPVYDQGQMIVVSPASERRRGDRVALCTQDGDIKLYRLSRESADFVAVSDLARGEREVRIPRENISWMSRIVWAIQ